MDFHFTEPQTDAERLFGGFHYINAIGRIEAGDDARFREFLTKVTPPPRLTVYIDSVGGDVEAAIGIGRLIRERWFSTSVGSYVLDQDQDPSYILPRKHIAGTCASAATLVYLGGRLRYLPNGSRFGVHRFSFRNPSPDDVGRSQVLSARIASYVEDMGVSTDFLELSSATSSTEIDTVDEEKLRALKVITDGETEAEWTLQARNHIMYVRGERDSLYGHHKVMLCYAKGTGFMFWAVIESQGREHELMSFGLVEIVVNGEDIRIDISQRCERQVSGIYTNVLARITEEEARAIAFSESFGVRIRFCDEAPVFLGISSVSTEGGKEELQTFFNTLCKT
ncbi:hypothetical protein [Rhodovulum kholense]|uniref:Uncharacterized protein n=1 Tax=Rhodovulum kholense TaxID=453584 RepID=A0A8E3APV3_9RHOB|nr:hypothetical protein [Rhodovulum kholense]PTW45293.1 hypothetical protein C8N38_114107 [Rhodovulum kholense]